MATKLPSEGPKGYDVCTKHLSGGYIRNKVSARVIVVAEDYYLFLNVVIRFIP